MSFAFISELLIPFTPMSLARNNVMSRAKPDLVLLSGNSHPDLAQKISARLDIRLGNCSLYHTSNRETLVDIGDSVRGRDVYIIQTGKRWERTRVLVLLISNLPTYPRY